MNSRITKKFKKIYYFDENKYFGSGYGVSGITCGVPSPSLTESRLSVLGLGFTITRFFVEHRAIKQGLHAMFCRPYSVLY